MSSDDQKGLQNLITDGVLYSTVSIFSWIICALVDEEYFLCAGGKQHIKAGKSKSKTGFLYQERDKLKFDTESKYLSLA